MKNPLNKRFKRELKQDFGKYLVIFLFLVMLISLVSSYLVVADSIEITFYEGWEKYNVEDGHIAFNQVPDASVLEDIEEQANLTFYDLKYCEEDLNDTTLRIYKLRDEVNLQCLVDGVLPAKDDEIAVNRAYADNNNLSIGDEITLKNKSYKITATVVYVDYNCLFENPQDMMFNNTNFGVAVMTDEAYENLNSSHQYYNYAFKYNTAPSDETEENSRSEELIDILEDEIKEYDTAIIQAQVDDLYDEARSLSDKLEDEFDDASDVIEEKMTDAGQKAALSAISSLSDAKKMELFLAGASDEDYLNAALEEENTTLNALIAAELGTSEKAITDLEDAIQDLETTMDDVSDFETPVINLDDVDEDYENEMDFSLDEIRNLVEKIDAIGLYDTSEISKTLDELEALMDYEIDDDDLLNVESYLPKYQNQSITYAMDDMSGDKPMYMVFCYIVVVIIAFVFAVTISNTIASEAGVIGTLRASGYSRGELVRHYLVIPLLVFLIAAVVGNVIGYTYFTSLYLDIFYVSFDLAPYEPRFNADAFLITTVVPFILMLVINLWVLTSKMRLSPMQFLRHELKTKVKRRAVLLNKKWPFMLRFRLRILFQNIPAYITLMIGIFFGAFIAVFGWMFAPLLEGYADDIINSQFCNYQYVLMDQIETDTKGAEKYCLYSLNSTYEDYLIDEINVFGIEDNSAYITTDIPAGEALISNGMAEKFNLSVGDVLTLKEPYEDKSYDFKVGGVYDYSASLSIFINRADYLDYFNEDEDYFTGYFTNEEITDIDEDDIATVITESDLTKVSQQLINSMGDFLKFFAYFGVAMFLLLMYLLTKQIIEKSMQSISMTKILGYRNGEIAGLYLLITSFVVLAALLISVPIIDLGIVRIFEYYLYKELTGYIPCVIDKSAYIKAVVCGLCCYALVSFFMMIKINKIEKSEALKNME